MANYKPAFLSKVTLTSSNNHLHFTANSVAKNCTVTAADYDDVAAVLAALETAMETAIGSAVITTSISTAGLVTIAYTGAGNFQLNHQTTDSNIGTLLGYDESADDTGAITYTSDWGHMYGFYHPYAVEYDSWERTVRYDPPPQVSMSGIVTRVTNSNDLQQRLVRLNLIPYTYFHPDYKTGTENTFLEFWDLASTGQPFEFYQHSDSISSGTTYCLIEPAESCLDVARHSADAAYYGPVTLRMQKQ